MKKYVTILLGLMLNYVLAYAGWDSDPVGVLNELKDSDVQRTALDNAVGADTKWVTNTLTAIKQASGGSLQWIAYLGLWIALILIVYNGIMLLISGITGSDEMWKFKKRFVSLVLWVVILTSGYLIIKFVVSIIWDLF